MEEIAKVGGCNDLVFTPPEIARMIVRAFSPSGKCLDPCRGRGAFYDNLPQENRDWCEISEGRDFFRYNEKVNWIISNPPYSIFEPWMDHSYELADNIVYLIPIGKVWSSVKRLRALRKYGGIRRILFVNPRAAGFPFGFPSAAVHFQRGYTGDIQLDWSINDSILRDKI